MKIQITFDLSREDREGIGDFFGYPLAEYRMCRNFIEQTITATLQSVCQDKKQNDEVEAGLLRDETSDND